MSVANPVVSSVGISVAPTPLRPAQPPVAYDPLMMSFDGTTGAYVTDASFTGNKFTVITRFSTVSTLNPQTLAAGTGNGQFGAGTALRFKIVTIGTSHPSPESHNTIDLECRSENGALLRFSARIPVGYLDGNPHTLLWALDYDNGLATIAVDDDNAVATISSGPSVATIAKGSGYFAVGGDFVYSDQETTLRPWAGDISYLGVSDTYQSNYSDFMTATQVKTVDTIYWQQFGGVKPAFWNENAFMQENKGYGGNMNVIDTITGPA